MIAARDPARTLADAFSLCAQPLRGHAHHAERPGAVSHTVPVGPAAAHERELGGERVESLGVVPTVAGMKHFESVEPFGDEGLHAFPCSGMSWMSQRSEEHTSELQSQSNLVCR